MLVSQRSLIQTLIFQTGHSEEHPGEWIWEHTNNTVQWFDWAPNEPNDYHRQQCMAYVRYTSLGVSCYACIKPNSSLLFACSSVLDTITNIIVSDDLHLSLE